MPRTKQDLYQTLRLDSSAVAADIRKAYRQAALCAHPDKGGTTEMFHALSLAFEVLSCPMARKAYDDMRSSRRRKPEETKTKKRCASAMHVQGSTPPKKHRKNDAPCSFNKPLHAKPQARNALESLKHVLQEMPHRQRLATVSNMDKRVRAALTFFMEKETIESDVDGRVVVNMQDRPISSPKAKVMKPHRGVWIVRGNGVRMYKARVNFHCLCLYGRWQPDLDTAIEHQIALVRIRNAIMTEMAHDPELCMKPKAVSKICRLALEECDVQETKLGLAAYVYMRAHGCRIESPALPLEQAWELKARLLEARKMSWEKIREMWIRLLCGGRKRMTASAAEVVVEKARKTELQRRYSMAVKRVGKSLGFWF